VVNILCGGNLLAAFQIANPIRVNPCNEALCLIPKRNAAPWFVLFILFCFWFLSQETFAAQSFSTDFAIENWQTDDGLPQNSVTAIFQGRDGYIYAGTYNGMVRFDGVRFVVFDSANTPELKNSRVTSLHQDSHGRIWIGHETGEVSWMEDGVFHSIDLGTNWPGGEIVSFGCDEKEDVWALNHDGVLIRLRDQKIVQPLPGAAGSLPGTPGLVRDNSGTLWMIYRGVAAFLHQGELNEFRFGTTDSSGAYFESACASHDGGLWVAGERQLRKWKDGKWTQSFGSFPWNQAFITTMLETQSGQLLVGTLDFGVFIFHPGGEISHLNRTNGLPHDWVRSLAEDREGNIWVGTSGGGLCVLRSRTVAMFSPPDDWQGRQVLSVTRGARDDIWAGTEGSGLYRFASGEWSHFDSSTGIGNPFVWSVLEDSQSNVWAGTWQGGLFRKSDTHFEMVSGFENFSVPITALAEDQNGALIIGTVTGLLWYRNEKLEWLEKSEHAPWPDIRALALESDGAIWFGMNSGGGLGNWRDGKVRIFSKKDGLPSNFILSLYLDSDNTLWVGTLDNGLCRFKNGKLAKINSKSGLANDVICGIADDGLGNFWFGSQSGIFRCTKAELNDCADGRIAAVHCLVFGKRQGMATLACTGGFQPAVCRTSDGRIWFPTGKGLAVVDPRSVQANKVKPPVWIESVELENKPAQIERTDNFYRTLTVPPGKQQVQFRFTALSFTSPERVKFKYKLEGLEKDWMDAAAREVNYSYLQPGPYRFRVIACNGDGIWNEEGASLDITVLPYFWQTWWFRVLAYSMAILFVGGSVLFATRRRLQLKLERLERQRALERERARIAKDIHDDIGATLTQITMLSQTASKALQHPQQAAQHLKQIFGAARSSTRALDEIVWAVNPKHDSLDSMATYFVRFAQDFLEPAGIRCRLDMPLELPTWALTAEVRHNLFLAYKEALNNVVKHASATEVRISLVLGSSSFSLCVADNGKGFRVGERSEEPDRLSGGNGLDNMKRRLEEIGGSCEIESSAEQGTKVKFEVRVAQRTY
jgi:signal transduction histidine kinase/ligand-binding sensor domain-containing protein